MIVLVTKTVVVTRTYLKHEILFLEKARAFRKADNYMDYTDMEVGGTNCRDRVGNW